MSKYLAIVLCLAVSALASTPLTVEDYATMTTISSPQFSPDGKRIVYTVTQVDLARSAYNSDIWIINADGSGRISLTDSYEEVQSPSWSPTGDKIVFTSTGYYVNSSIVVISSNGVPYAPIPLTGYVFDPAWRP